MTAFAAFFRSLFSPALQQIGPFRISKRIFRTQHEPLVLNPPLFLAYLLYFQ
jgi:hypothetical protein